MANTRPPVTAAIRVLRAAAVAYRHHLFDYQPRGGAAQGARELGVDAHLLVKTLLLEDDGGNPLVVLMHGDREVSTKTLARRLGVKTVAMCDPAVAARHSGYQVGGTSPFGLRSALPIYIETSILTLPTLYINGGKRGFLLEMTPGELKRVLEPIPVTVAVGG